MRSESIVSFSSIEVDYVHGKGVESNGQIPRDVDGLATKPKTSLCAGENDIFNI
jgi:hypothetical protein